MQILLFVSLAVAALAVVFALQNNTPVALSFLTWSFQSTLAVAILIAVVAGAVAGFLATIPGTIRLRWQLRSARHRVGQLEAAVAKAGVPVHPPSHERSPGPEVGAGP